MVRRTKQNLLPEITRTADEFYVIELKNDIGMLHREVLKMNHVERDYKGSRWYLPENKLDAYKKGVLTIATIKESVSYKLTIIPSKSEIKVACSCGKPAKKLCQHAHEFFDLALDSAFDFQWFQPGGLYETAVENPDYFKIGPSRHHAISINAKEGMPAVYGIEKRKEIVELPEILNWGDCLFGDRSVALSELKPSLNWRHGAVEVDNMQLTFIIITPMWYRIFPLLTLCTGFMNKSGTAIKRLDYLPVEPHHDYGVPLTEKQQELHKIAFEMRAIGACYEGAILYDFLQEKEFPDMKRLHGLWQRAVPLLVEQKYLFESLYYSPLKAKKKLITSGDRAPVVLEPYVPKLSFELADTGRYKIFSLRIKVKDVQLSEAATFACFFIKNAGLVYLLSCVRDIGVVEYMKMLGGRICVFPNQFEEFNTRVMQPLQAYYEVVIV